MAEPARLHPRSAPSAPDHLSAESVRLFESVTSDYELEPWHIGILTEALQSRDRAEQARRQLDADGLTVEGRFGPRPHPLLSVERDHRATFARLLKSLGLDIQK